MTYRSELCKKFKIGQKVKIKQDITITKDRFSSTADMNFMAQNDETYTIESVGRDRIYIRGCMWSPEDIIDGEDDAPLPLPKTNILFDPKELI